MMIVLIIIAGVTSIPLLSGWFAEAVEGEGKPHKHRALRILYKIFLGSLIGIAIMLFVPSQDAIIKAYLMKEGANLVTAKNADKVVEDITKRLDKMIDKLVE
jgi:hypothetical protein